MKGPCRRPLGFMRRIWAILLPLIIAGIILAVYPLTVLSLEAQGKVLSRRIVRPGDTFQLGYLHSVAKSDVWDTFQVDSQGRILLLETRFQGQAYGLPGGPADREQWTREGDWFRITGMDRIVPSIIGEFKRSGRIVFVSGMNPK